MHTLEYWDFTNGPRFREKVGIEVASVAVAQVVTNNVYDPEQSGDKQMPQTDFQ